MAGEVTHIKVYVVIFLQRQGNSPKAGFGVTTSELFWQVNFKDHLELFRVLYLEHLMRQYFFSETYSFKMSLVH